MFVNEDFVDIPYKPFQMQKTQVTQHQWETIMKSNPSYFINNDNPVEMVSWDDCQEFIKALNDRQKDFVYSLPTEEQWEYCCRAGSTTEYCFGDDESKLKDYAWYWENSEEFTHPVAQKKPNDWGLYDMHGNVWEWTASLYRGAGSIRVLRGGSWFNSPVDLRSALRNYGLPGLRCGIVGLRLLRTPSSLLPSNPSKPQASDKREEAKKLIKQIRAKLRKLEELL